MFEKYIKNHREVFDQGPLPEGHEARFAHRIHAAKPAGASITIPLRRVWQAAAAIILIMISVQTGSFFFAKQKPADIQPPQEVLTELSDIELYYGSKVRQEMAQLKGEAWKEADHGLLLTKDLDDLEEEYKELKESILTEGRNEYLIDALIKNFQERIKLLQEISNIIKQSKTDHERENYQSS